MSDVHFQLGSYERGPKKFPRSDRSRLIKKVSDLIEKVTRQT